jgi:beta-glucosidase
MRDDVDLMAGLGLTAYRFSIAWPRVIPDGSGQVNDQGLDFYDRLVEALLEKNIKPYATLYHWDLPQALEDRGGWYSRDTVAAFELYAEAVLRRLGDRVEAWITLNEPWVQAWHGYANGVHAPGRNDGPGGAVKAGHHLLLAHGRGMEVIRSLVKGCPAGITLDFSPIYPASDSAADLRAVDRADAVKNRWFLEPVVRGSYPNTAPDLLEHLPDAFENDLAVISVPIDFLGVNYYSRAVVAADPATGMDQPVHVEGVARTDSGWEVFPDGLRVLLESLANEYGIETIYVTENGAAYADGPGLSGAVHDARRVEYLMSHFHAAAEAMSAGAGLAGYFVWSLLDNFEWAEAYDEKYRFGMVYVGYDTQERVIKDSGKWYSQLIAAHSGSN